MKKQRKTTKANKQLLDLQDQVDSLTKENQQLVADNQQLKEDLDNVIKTTVKADDFNSILEQLNAKKEQLQQLLNQNDEQQKLIQKLEEKLKIHEEKETQQPKTDVEILAFENSKLQTKIKILESKNNELITENTNLTNENKELHANHQKEILDISNSLIQNSNTDEDDLTTNLAEKEKENEKLRLEIAALQNTVDQLMKSSSAKTEITNKKSEHISTSIDMYKKLLEEFASYKESVATKLENYNIVIPKLCSIFNSTPETLISKSMSAVIANNLLLERDLEISKLKVKNYELELHLASLNKDQQEKLDAAVHEHASKLLNATELLKIQTVFKQRAKNFEENITKVLSELVNDTQTLTTNVNGVYTKLIPSFTPSPSPKRKSQSPSSAKIQRIPLGNLNNIVRSSPQILRPNVSDYD